jgi:Glycosyltransferase family 6
MKTALLLIALGQRYRDFLVPFLESADKYFVPHTPIIWCDDIDTPASSNCVKIYQPDVGFPGATLQRYRMFYEQASLLTDFDQVFYCDVDMLWVAPVTGDMIFSEGITATLHPGYIVDRIQKLVHIRTVGTPDRNPRSTAMIPQDANNKYFCGGFNGGDARAFLQMSDVLRQNIDKDYAAWVMAMWHDESHLNRYLYDNPPAKILTPSFCYPEDYRGQYGWDPEEYLPILMALDKGKKCPSL